MIYYLDRQINLCYYTSWSSLLVAGAADDAEINKKTTTRMAKDTLAIIFALYKIYVSTKI